SSHSFVSIASRAASGNSGSFPAKPEMPNLCGDPPGRTRMRAIAFVIALFAAELFAANAPAAAQSWKEYSYPSYSFAVSFPAEPKVETTMYQAADGRSVQAQVYSVTQDNGVFTM